MHERTCNMLWIRLPERLFRAHQFVVVPGSDPYASKLVIQLDALGPRLAGDGQILAYGGAQGKTTEQVVPVQQIPDVNPDRGMTVQNVLPVIAKVDQGVTGDLCAGQVDAREVFAGLR